MKCVVYRGGVQKVERKQVRAQVKKKTRAISLPDRQKYTRSNISDYYHLQGACKMSKLPV